MVATRAGEHPRPAASRNASLSAVPMTARFPDTLFQAELAVFGRPFLTASVGVGL